MGKITKPEWKLESADYIENHEGLRFWFGDPSQLFPTDLWLDMRSDMAAYIRDNGISGGRILMSGKTGIWQATGPELDAESVMAEVKYPGGITSIRLSSPILMALPSDVAEQFMFPAPGITTIPFNGQIQIDHHNRDWTGSIELSW